MPEAVRTTRTASRVVGWTLSTLMAPFARRFIAGTALPDALDALARLKARGFSTTVDHLGEKVESREETEIATGQYVVMLKALKERALDRNISVKLSQLGLDFDVELCAINLERIVKAAEDVGGFVRVDMEGSDLTGRTIEMVLRMKRTRLTPIGVALQAMLIRTPEDALSLIGREIPIRLCKGAYREPARVALQRMEDVQRAFISIAKRLLTTGLRHGIATHDPWLIEEIKKFAAAQGIAKDRFEFQMLYGIRRRLAQSLVAEGYRVRIYVPFGRSWVPYTWRRIRERKENLMFIVKHFFVR
ncbi:MAG: proline dehydrogenase family protein [Proteobacteria bacterium]|nr:proline dehydrogenase family protein [Pseudomonadota bacterium]